MIERIGEVMVEVMGIGVGERRRLEGECGVTHYSGALSEIRLASLEETVYAVMYPKFIFATIEDVKFGYKSQCLS